MNIDSITASVNRIVTTRGAFLKNAAPATLAIGLAAAAMAPAALGAPSLAATLGMGLGTSLLAGLVQDIVDGLRKQKPNSPVSEDDLRSELEAALTRQWQGGGPAAAALRTEISQVLQATKAVDLALTAATGDVKQALAQGFAQLSVNFGEFGWVLSDMRGTLAGIQAELSVQGVRQRDDFELQQQQLFKLNLIIQRLAVGVPAPLPEALDDETTPPADVACPYKGLASFQPQDADDFFGRETLLAEITARLSTTTFYALIGPSGSGKSSLLRAGLLPGVYRGTLPGAWTSLVLNPGPQPMLELAARIALSANLPVGDLVAEAQTGDAVLDRALERLAGAAGAQGRLMLAVDQFEEIFTVCHDETQRRRFVESLLRAARRADRRICVVLALRADHFGDCAAYPDLAAAMQDNQTLVGALSVHELRQVIERPAARIGLRVQAALVDQIIEDVAGQPGGLPLLSHVLLETWKRRRGRTLTLTGYREAGGVSGAIAQTAESVFAQLAPQQQVIARDVFLRLIEPGAEGAQDARRRAPPDELSPSPELRPAVERVLATLEAARLITADEGTVEVAHEALIREWPALRQWLDDSREDRRRHQRLAEAAAEWARLQREEGALYRGLPLAAAAEWAAAHAEQLNRLERQFLDASQALAQREGAQRDEQRQRELQAARKLAAAEQERASAEARRAEAETRRATAESLKSAAESNRAEVEMQRAREQAQANTRLRGRNRAITAVGGVAVLAAIVACVLGLAAAAFGWSASNSAALAQQQATVALSRQLAAQGLARASRQFDLSALLSVEAVRTADTVEARAALLAGLQGNPALLYYLPPSVTSVRQVAFSPDGTILAVVVCKPDTFSECIATEVLLWDVAGRKLIGQPMQANDYRAATLAFSPDGKRLASGGCGQYTYHLCSQGSVRLWDVTSGQPLGTPQPALTDTIRSVAFSLDGRLVAAGSLDTILLLDGSSLQPAAAPLVARSVLTLAFGPDGLLASAGSDGKVTLWDVNARKPLGPPLGGNLLYVEDLKFSPDGQTLASAGSDGLISLWNFRTGRRIGNPFAGHTDTIWSIAFGSGGKTLASASEDQTVRLWDVKSGRQITPPLLGHTTGVSAVAFSSDGQTLASASTDKVILWDTAGSRALWRTLSPNYARAVAFSPDGQWAAWTDNGAIQLWDRQAQRPAGQLAPSGASNIWCVTFSPDSKLLASSSEDGTILLWDLASQAQVGQPLSGHTGQVYNLAFSPDGKILASAGDDGNVVLSSVATGLPIGPPIHGAGNRVTDVSFSPNGKLFATANHEARLWNTANGLPASEPLTVTNGSGVSGVAFSPDGKLLATDDDFANRIWLWRVDTHQPAGALVGPLLKSGDVGVQGALSFSPDGKMMAAGLDTDEIVLWDLATRQQIGLLASAQDRPGRDIGRSIAFSPDGKSLLSGGTAVTLWDIDPSAWVTRACDRVGRNLTRDEWALYLGSLPYHQTCAQWPSGQ